MLLLQHSPKTIQPLAELLARVGWLESIDFAQHSGQLGHLAGVVEQTLIEINFVLNFMGRKRNLAIPPAIQQLINSFGIARFQGVGEACDYLWKNFCLNVHFCYFFLF